MASAALRVDRTRWARPERELFAEWGPRCQWILRQND